MMPDTHVRPACLDDTQSISAMARSRIGVWQRLGGHGQVEDVPYATLTVYERWLHGGPWMSVETGAIQLNHLLLGAGFPLVAERDGHILAYVEAYRGVEPSPFGDHIHLGNLVVSSGASNAGLEHALLSYVIELARVSRCARFTANCVANDAETGALYTQLGMQPIARVERVSLPARTGQVFYRAVEHPNADAAQIGDFYMPVGRIGSARQQWESLWPPLWNAIAEIRERRTHRVHFSAAGQEAFICCQQQLYDPRSAALYCWSPKPLSGQLLTAIRDWSHREGYRTLVMAVTPDTLKTLGAEAEPDGYYQEVYAVDV
jgi:GNAT superfamily N-acetyltransferase